MDIRWYLDGRSGRASYESGHIPGAVFVDLDGEITGPSGPGRHPLPPPEQFAQAMRRAGISRDSFVVAYDDAGGSIAARLWWLLGYFGHSASAVLDGGIQAWTGPLETEPAQVEDGDFEAGRDPRFQVAGFDDLVRRDPPGVLLDARAPERFRGDEEPIDPKAGHIPGAVNAFWRSNLESGGRFRSAESLAEHYRSLGVTSTAETIVYCGSGVTSCHDLLALQLAGLGPGVLYAGSWSDWAARDAPVATGG